MSKYEKKPINILGAVYEKMYENIAKDFKKAENKTVELLHNLIEEAAEKASELGELSREDLEKIAEYLKRDLSDAANYLSKTGKEFKDWLGFESTLLETEISHQILDTADPTTVELLKLKINASIASGTYCTGEVTGPGTLLCDTCGENLHFYKAGKIPPCPKCHSTSFHREPVTSK